MIYLTGASGYLGQHIMRLGNGGVVAVPRGKLNLLAGQVVIHAAWPTPKTDAEAMDEAAHRAGFNYTVSVATRRPRFLVLIGTRSEMPSHYRHYKVEAERCPQVAMVDRHVVRLPGLYGPPRRSGLMYEMFRAALAGRPFTPDHSLPTWTAMRVERAAQFCLNLAQAALPGFTIARDPEFEQWLTFCRASS